MDRILVTGVSGVIGKNTVGHLLQKGVPSNQIVGLARKKDGLDGLVAKGIEIRLGDYFDYGSLLRAFDGIDKIMLTSAVAFSDRFTQHYNVITAARQAGVKHVIYMAIMRKAGSKRVMPEITESDLFTEQLLKSSGLDYTIVYHPPFIDVLHIYYDSNPYENGISVPAGNGKMAPATRDDLAAAHAEILATPGHKNKTYSLGGSGEISFEGIANILGDIKGRPIRFNTISAEDYVKGLVAKGKPRKVAEFLTEWVVAIEKGEFGCQSGDLERLLGRQAKSFRQFLDPSLS